ncbi:MAG: SemiSWEET transporter [Betaproteobacteria bacterium]
MTHAELIRDDMLGLVAGALTTVAFVPQIVHIARTRSAYDISWGLFGILGIGSMLWLWYGIRINSLPLMVTNVLTLLMQVIIFALKWRYGRGAARDHAKQSLKGL